MPTLMRKDDLMRTVANLGRAQEVWMDAFDTASGEFSLSLPHGGSYQVVIMRVSPSEAKESAKKEIHYGLLKDKLKNWNYETDRELDAEVVGMFDCLREKT